MTITLNLSLGSIGNLKNRGKNMKTINEVSKLLKMSISSIYFYEKEKIVVPCRGTNNYRYYSEHDIKILKLTKILREYNFSVEEIIVVVKNYEGISKGKDTSTNASIFFEHKKESLLKKMEGYRDIIEIIDHLPVLDNGEQLLKKKREADVLIEHLFEKL